LVYLSVLLFPNSYIILFWEFYFIPFSVHVQTNIIFWYNIINKIVRLMVIDNHPVIYTTQWHVQGKT
jgi:hypothetical protein